MLDVINTQLVFLRDNFVAVFFMLMVMHFICDYPLQGDFLSHAKKYGPIRLYHLLAHSTIQAGGVFLVTGSLVLGTAELIAHFIIDELKNRDIINYKQDQLMHIFCKVWWISYIVYGGYFF